MLKALFSNALDTADKGDAAGAAKHASEAETHLKAADKK